MSKRIKRLSDIVERLKRSTDGLTTKELAKEFGLSQRCIQKDIQALTELGFSIKKIGNRYKLSPSNRLYVDLLSETEIFYLLSLNRAIQEIYPAESHSISNLISTKILPAQKYEEVIIFGLDYAMDMDESDKEKIKLLIDAIQTRRKVSFTFEYRGVENNRLLIEKYKLEVEPYRIGYHHGFWYLIGAKVEGNTRKLRVFSLYKISDIEILNKRFSEIPKKIREMRVFKPYLPESEASNGVRAKIRVMPEAVIYFEKKKYAEHQQLLKKLDDGSAIFEIKANSFLEILQLIVIPWIPQVIVLEPQHLANEACKEVTEWLELQKSIAYI